jgi:hypothetical protein
MMSSLPGTQPPEICWPRYAASITAFLLLLAASKKATGIMAYSGMFAALFDCGETRSTTSRVKPSASEEASKTAA